jgi:UDP-N-acetylmuramoylalanine--D-glutamate ligase
MLDFSYLKNKKVVVMGLGLLGGGVETVKWLVKNKAQVLVTDLKTKSQLRDSLKKLKGLPVNFFLGGHPKKIFQKADLIIKNPGVPRDSQFLKIARKNKIPVESDLSIFFRLFQGKIIGISGTKGKSTTASLLFHILKTAKKKVFLAGNIGQSPLKYLNQKMLKCSDVIAILEISSWQLEDMAHLKKSPQIACLTTIFPDHLDTYRNFADYIEAKKLIFKYQTKNDFLVLNADEPITKKFAKEAKGKIVYFSTKKSSIRILNNKIIIPNYSILAALTIALILKIPLGVIKKAIKTFRGLANHLELVREKGGVRYYNDSASTVPQSTIFALNSLAISKNIILISGGADKKLNFKEMARKIKEKCKAVILLPGTATPKIHYQLLTINYKKPVLRVKTMKEAVEKANKFAQRGDIILLSPGCASFGLFQNAYDRAKEFIREVDKLK